MCPLLLMLMLSTFMTLKLMTLVPGTKKSHFYFSSSGVLKVNTKRGSSSVSNYFTLTRRYYVHKSYNRFHRQLVDIKGIFIE